MAAWVSFTNGLNNYCALDFISHLNDPIYVLEENMVWVLFCFIQSMRKDKIKSHKSYQKMLNKISSLPKFPLLSLIHQVTRNWWQF